MDLTGSPGASPDVYGMVRLGGIDLALPLDVLREVVPCPGQLSGLPVRAPGLLGAMDLRTTVLPVVDLRVVLELPAARHADQVVVVIAWEGQALGLLADEVCGLARVPASALLNSRSLSGHLLFSRTFLHPETGRPTCVLDPAAVLRLPGVPTVDDVTRTTAAVVAGGAGPGSGAVRTITRVSCGGHVLAIDVAHVHTTLPSPVVRSSPLDSELVCGVTGYAGAEVGVVDPLVLLGLGSRAAGTPGAGLVLDTGGGYVVLALDGLLDLVPVTEGQLLAVPPFALPRPELLEGVVEVDGQGCLVLDGPALLAEPQLRGVAAMNVATGQAGGGARSDRSAAGTGGQPYLTFSIGVDVVTPLEHVAEIVPYPAEVTRTATAGVLGVVVHRGAAVPVLCLAAQLGFPPREITAASCLLLVGMDGATIGFAVDALRSIDPLSWADPAQVRGRAGARTVQNAPLVQVGEDSRLLPCLDLPELARAVRGPVPVPVPVPRSASTIALTSA